ncbi:metalloreductase STEAP3 [Spea bombifrons]|uniref:metalloreductase STEAP3 n=1 Tax=Spea bombifrons TaxID=233779 RepID=UPI00234A2591|nr:metalloreductase STEAP3 [Spea bombifrons]XP_053327594.1 metalloreductase STEAP3 [Spea bombifrons]
MVQSDMAKPLLSADPVEGATPRVLPHGDTVGILGSGDFARSLAARLLFAGFKVVVGSRNPKRSAALFPAEVEVTLQEDAAKRADLLFVAMFREHYPTLSRFSDALAGKVLVDVSNNHEINLHGESNAEYLASLLPKCHVVKGFNVVSAWALQSGPQDGNKQVLICSDSPEARSRVSLVARGMGFIPVDMGALCAARDIENVPLRLLPSWKMPVLLAAGLFVFFYGYNFVRGVLHPYLVEKKNAFYTMPVKLVNVTLPCVAYVLLSLVYLPGILAAFYQLHYGTKYRRFPGWLDGWLKHRKQMGLTSFFCASLHAVYSLCLPMRRSARYLLINEAVKQMKANASGVWVEEEVWRMEIYVSLGIIALGTLAILAVASLPSVGNSLNWREFSFIQSKLGFAALILGTLHTLTFGWRRAFLRSHYKFFLPPTFTLTLAVPFAIILGKMVLLLPCVDTRLTLIRRGWEKGRRVTFAAQTDAELAQSASSV